MEGGRKDCSQDSPCEVRILEGLLWSLLFASSRKIGEGLAEGNRASVGWQVGCPQMSTPGSASEPCLAEGYLVGGENGKIVFWKA